MARVGRDRALVRITSEPLRLEEAARFVADPAAGATCLFCGTVRSSSEAGDVVGITYEAWTQLAERRLDDIVGELFDRWPTCRAAVLHRTGQLGVGDISVIVACSTPHRADAYDACRHAIERLKHDVPIWKKEALVSGDAHWVMGS
jgi:molybdopterin synthase catalytic subunit